MDLVEITPASHDVEISLAYAISDNITGAPIYRRALCYLHRDAATCLEQAIKLAGAIGLRFKIFDAFRPSEAQWALWNKDPNPEFLADPRRGSPHSRGVAIDLTLIDRRGVELEMGTGFDDFTPRAHHACLDLPIEAQKNRAVLLGLMTASGWDFYRNEWWHYQLFSSRNYPLYSDAETGLGMM
ncbi:MAG: D-alanyl-D-alanine dipeptidase [Dongiaceae bacterium]